MTRRLAGPQPGIPRLLKHFHQVKVARRSIQRVESHRPEGKHKRLARPFVPHMGQVIHEVLFADGYLQGCVSNQQCRVMAVQHEVKLRSRSEEHTSELQSL